MEPGANLTLRIFAPFNGTYGWGNRGLISKMLMLSAIQSQYPIH
jgi:hypothetical protein